MAAPEEPWCLTSNWVADGTDRDSSWESSKGILQTDGYAAYDQIGGPKMVHAGVLGAFEKALF